MEDIKTMMSKTWRDKIIFCVPKRLHAKRCEDNQKQDPNIFTLCILSYTLRNNKNGTEVLVWSVHVVETAQSKHNQTPLQDCILEMIHKVVHKVIGFESLA